MKYLRYSIFVLFFSLFIHACDNDKEKFEPPPVQPHFSVKDSLALVDIYEQGDGKNWFVRWDLTNVYTWGGVGAYLDSVEMEWRVIYLDIPWGTQNGMLSPKVGDLSELRRLTLSGHGFHGMIPAEIGKLSKLESLQIYSTDMEGGIPKEIFGLPYLYELRIADNLNLILPDEVSNYSPEYFGVCQLINNNFGGKVPSGIKVQMNLSENNYTEVPFEYYTDTSKPYLNLSYNKISGVIPDYVLNDSVAMCRLVLMAYPQQKGYGYTNIPEKYIKKYYGYTGIPGEHSGK